MKKFLLSLTLALLSIAIMLSVVCCGSNTGGDNNFQNTEVNESITLSTSSVEITEGEKFLLKATVTPFTNQVVWSSSNENIAVVNTNGLITAVSKGTTTIKATTTSGKVNDTCVVKVIEKQSTSQSVSIVLSKTQVELDVGDTYTLSAMVNPHDNNTKISWTSTNEKIVTVKDGLLTGISAGTAFVRAQVGSASAVCSVEVKEVYGSVSGTVTCYNWKTSKYEIDTKAYIYLISYNATEINLLNILLARAYNYPDGGIYFAPVDALGAFSIENIKLGKYRVIICTGTSDFDLPARERSTAEQRRNVFGVVYDHATSSSKSYNDDSANYLSTSFRQMIGFDVNVEKTPIKFTKTVIGVTTTGLY